MKVRGGTISKKKKQDSSGPDDSTLEELRVRYQVNIRMVRKANESRGAGQWIYTEVPISAKKCLDYLQFFRGYLPQCLEQLVAYLKTCFLRRSQFPECVIQFV
jgi:hypothetical protein